MGTRKLQSIGHLGTFRIKIKKWKPEIYLCMLCKVYIDQVGFL